MCRIMEDIVQKERLDASQKAVQKTRHEEFLQLVKRAWEQKFSLAQMIALSGRTEDEVLAAFGELGLPIPN